MRDVPRGVPRWCRLGGVSTSRDIPPPADGLATEDWVPSREACRRLGISSSTLDRRIKGGALRAEGYRRPQGSYLLVYAPLRDAPEDIPRDIPPTPRDIPPTPQEDPPEDGRDIPRDEARDEGRGVDVGPLVALLGETQARLLAETEARVVAEARLEVETAHLVLAEARGAELEQALREIATRAEQARRPWWDWWLVWTGRASWTR